MNFTLKKKVQLGLFAVSATLIAISIAALYLSYSAAANFVEGGSKQSEIMSLLADLERNFGTQKQDWKNVLLRGADPKAFEKHSKGIDEAAEKQLATAATLKSLISEHKRDFVTKYEENLKAFSAKLKETRGQFFTETVFDPKAADKAMHGLDRNIMDPIVELSKELNADAKASEVAMLSKMKTGLYLAIGFSLGAGLLIFLLVNSLVGKSITAVIGVIDQLRGVSTTVERTSTGIAESSVQISASTTEQAASLEETAASIEEMSSMVQKNSDNASSVAKISNRSMEAASKGKEAVERMLESMNDIDRSNQKIIEIVNVIREIDQKTKVINDIVFKTQLLSFNASVEAARAGEHGKGFAVVAEEVGNLARMSGGAAEEISALLESSIQKVETIVEETRTKVEAGSVTAKQCSGVLDEVVSSVSDVATMASEISVASTEQAQGVQQISKAMSQIDQTTQQNARVSEAGSENAKELSSQATMLQNLVQVLTKEVMATGEPNHATNAGNSQAVDFRATSQKTKIRRAA